MYKDKTYYGQITNISDSQKKRKCSIIYNHSTVISESTLVLSYHMHSYWLKKLITRYIRARECVFVCVCVIKCLIA